jgi:predicted MPP superfamily phosphohydrolase
MSLRQSSFFLRLLILALLVHGYVGLRLLPDASLSRDGIAAAILALFLSCLLILLGLLGHASLRGPWADRMAWLGLLTMGLFSSLFVFTVLRDGLLLTLLGINTVLSPPWELGPLQARSAWAVVLLAGLATLLGLFNARRRARVITVDVPIEALPAALQGFTIVQISDLHVGPTIKRRYVQKIVDAVNKIKPDLIAITGDVVDGSVERLALDTQPLADLFARYGVYLVTGNHEYYSGVTSWVAEFRRLGLRVLINEHVVLHPQGVPIIVAGVTDYGAAMFEPLQRSNPRAALAGAPANAALRLLLAHQPRSAVAAQALEYTLQLSGHTHGGEFFPWGFFVRLQQP